MKLLPSSREPETGSSPPSPPSPPSHRGSPESPDFLRVLGRHGHASLTRPAVKTVQVNVGRLCNMACHHCHVDAGPKRTEQMSAEVADRLLTLLAASPGVECLDLTGGAPELNAEFRRLVRVSRRLGLRVIDRCNLSVLFEPGQEELAAFLAEERVEVVASLPCYLEDNVDQQRGRGAFDKSIDGLRVLNALGYGRSASGLLLDLVYNPKGASLPPAQASLEAAYRRELGDRFGVEFGRLLTLTNMPIRRFARELTRTGRFGEYMSLLVNHFNPGTVDGVMCRSLVSVGWEGGLFDCDFNQMLGMPSPTNHRSLWQLESFAELADSEIATASHCFGCTAGAGSSCGGALA